MLKGHIVSILLNIATVVLYTLAASGQYSSLVKPGRIPKLWVMVLGMLAVGLHAVALHQWIDVGLGQNLSVLNLFSMVAWLVALLTLVLAFFRPVANLGIVIYPLAAFSIVLAMGLPGHHVIDTAADPRQLVHILLSILTFSILVMASFQALLLLVQQNRLRSKQVYKLPPLETMESLLFQLIMLGFLFLTVLLITSFYFYHEVLWQRFLQKSIFACAAWLMLALLLVGRQVFGWRGKRATYCTLTGIGLLVLTYMCSSVLLVN